MQKQRRWFKQFYTHSDTDEVAEQASDRSNRNNNELLRETSNVSKSKQVDIEDLIKWFVLFTVQKQNTTEFIQQRF